MIIGDKILKKMSKTFNSFIKTISLSGIINYVSLKIHMYLIIKDGVYQR
jgi:hypothetical protein